jgi:tetratricopeptide (TPR) repeat protein
MVIHLAHFSLNLVRTDAPIGRASAWLIPGSDATEWLNEIAALAIPMQSLQLYMLPRSTVDASVAGVLVVLPPGVEPSEPPRALPYRLLAERLYLPLDAILDLPISDQELRDKLLWPLNVLHPTIGLVGFAAEDTLRVPQLFTQTPRRAAAWDRAIFPPPQLPRLRSVETEMPATLDAVLDATRDDIGSESPQQLPTAPEESSTRKLMNQTGLSFLQAMQWLSRQMPGGKAPSAGTPAAPSGFSRWISKNIEALRGALEAARNRELNRLLRMLESNPDEGLKYALPLSALDASRGRVPPGSMLPRRPIDFNLRKLQGGEPVDSWNFAGDMQQRLQQKYRLAANRELGLGRYRRAAYIFAHLLGDYASAANALVQGRHFQDAAVLYRDHLKNPAAAANCLEKGGLLIDAIKIYDELANFEKVAELYSILERPQDAAIAYRKAVDRHISHDDILSAAGLLERKLLVPEEALTLLKSSWPASRQSSMVLRAWFDLNGKLGRHAAAMERLAQLRESSAAQDLVERVADVLATVATSYPDTMVRRRSADTTRILVGQRLAQPGLQYRRELVAAVLRLDSADRLLARDGPRYLAAEARKVCRRTPATEPVKRRSSAQASRPTLLKTMHFGSDVAWKCFTSRGDVFFAFGTRGDEAIVLRGHFNGAMQRVSWKARDLCTYDHFLFEPLPARQTLILVPRGVWMPVLGPMMPVADIFSEPITPASPPFLPKHMLAVCSNNESDVLCALYSASPAEPLVLARYDLSSGSALSTLALPNPTQPFDTTLTSMVARNEMVFVALDSEIHHCDASKERWHTHLSHPIQSLIASAPLTRVRLAATFTEGGALVWPNERHVEPFGHGLFDPKTVFTRGGCLVALGRGEGRTYHPEQLRLRHGMTFDVADDIPLAIAPTSSLQAFAEISRTGLLRVLEIPAS